MDRYVRSSSPGWRLVLELHSRVRTATGPFSPRTGMANTCTESEIPILFNSPSRICPDPKASVSSVFSSAFASVPTRSVR